MNQNQNEERKPGTIEVLVHSFFVIPFIITVFAVLFFFMFKVLVNESNSAYDYLNEIKIGSATKRWQSAFELGKILSNPDLVPESDKFKNEMISVYNNAINDNSLVRTYLALAMGKTQDSDYGETLLNGLNDEDANSRSAAINALGMIKYRPAVKKLLLILDHNNMIEDRLATVIALGMIGDVSVIDNLKNLLLDEEPNIRWDAAIALAKMNDKSGILEIKNLLDRKYLNSFTEIDEWEKVQAILVAIEMTKIIVDESFIKNLRFLANNDKNMKIVNNSIKILKNIYKVEL